MAKGERSAESVFSSIEPVKDRFILPLFEHVQASRHAVPQLYGAKLRAQVSRNQSHNQVKAFYRPKCHRFLATFAVDAKFATFASNLTYNLLMFETEFERIKALDERLRSLRRFL